MDDNVLIVFVREPVEGQVKTRLAESIGEMAACQCYEAFLKDMAVKLKAVEACERSIYYTYGDGTSFLRSVFSEYPLFIQQGEHLGERMLLAFLEAFKEGARKVVLIGSDCPDLPAENIQEAFAKLENVDAVLGPCSDGGYYLIGMNQFRPELFENVQWGTQKVLQQTLKGAEKGNIRVGLLKQWADIDTIEDLKKLHVRLAGSGRAGCAEHTRELLQIIPL